MGSTLAADRRFYLNLLAADSPGQPRRLRQFLQGSDGKAHAMGRVAIAYQPPSVDCEVHGLVNDLIVEAKPLGNLMHADPTVGPAARHAYDIVANGNRHMLRTLWPSVLNHPAIRGLWAAACRLGQATGHLSASMAKRRRITSSMG
jgi:hypothetical protein